MSCVSVREQVDHDRLDVEDRIVAAIRRVIRAVDLHSRRLQEEHGLTGPQLAVLKHAAELGPVSAGRLAQAVHLSQATVTGILTRLEQRGLLARTRGMADRRTVEVNVTESGRMLLGSTPSLLQERFRRHLTRLEEWERLLILATLQKVASMMEAGDLDASPHLISGPVTGGTGSEPAADGRKGQGTPG